MTNHQAAMLMVKALRALGRVEPVDEAMVMSVLSLAVSVDGAPDNASLWREYRSAIADLRNIGGSNEQGNEIEKLIEALRGGPEVRDAPPPKPKQSRPRSRKADGAVRDPADAVAAARPRRGVGDRSV
jgi:hypothetical protein